MSDIGTYSVVRYVPDPRRNEGTNIGVVVASNLQETFRFKFLSGFTGKGIPTADKPVLKAFKRQFEGDVREEAESRSPESLLQELFEDLQNSIQFTEPRSVRVINPDEVLKGLFDTFVAPRVAGEDTGRVTHKTMVKRISGRFRNAGLQRFVKRNVTVAGHFGRYRMDFGVKEKPSFIHAVPIDTEPERKFIDVSVMWEGKVRDLLKEEAHRHVTLVISPRVHDFEYPDRLREARDLFREAGAETVDYDELGPLMEIVSSEANG